MTLIDSIIDSYSSEKDYENYGGFNLVLEIELEGTEGIEKIDSFCKHNESNKRSLVGDILGFGEANIEGSKTKPYTKTDKVTIYEKDEVKILRNKFKFFTGIMFLAKEEINKISKDEIKEKLDEGRCMEIFYTSLKNIAPKLTYISPGDDDKTKKAKRNEGLKKFINFFLVILYHFFSEQYQAQSDEKAKNDKAEIKLSFSVIRRFEKIRIKGLLDEDIALNVSMFDIRDQYEKLQPY